MTPIKVNLGGQDRFLSFGNFTTVELNKLLFDNPFESPDIGKLLDRCNDMIKDNYFLFYKALIYSAIVGNDYERNRFTPSCTIEEVGAWVAEMSNDELTEFFVKVWNAFFDAMGVNLERVKELEAADNEKKK